MPERTVRYPVLEDEATITPIVGLTEVPFRDTVEPFRHCWASLF
jgi:hypothetical protein